MWFNEMLEKFENDPEFIWMSWDLIEDEDLYIPLTCDMFIE